jgi:hypothetical protein
VSCLRYLVRFSIAAHKQIAVDEGSNMVKMSRNFVVGVKAGDGTVLSLYTPIIPSSVISGSAEWSEWGSGKSAGR